MGIENAVQKFHQYVTGLDLYKGKLTLELVADTFNMDYTPAEKALVLH